jgi:hypothetical protein
MELMIGIAKLVMVACLVLSTFDVVFILCNLFESNIKGATLLGLVLLILMGVFYICWSAIGCPRLFA